MNNDANKENQKLMVKKIIYNEMHSSESSDMLTTIADVYLVKLSNNIIVYVEQNQINQWYIQLIGREQ